MYRYMYVHMYVHVRASNFSFQTALSQNNTSTEGAQAHHKRIHKNTTHQLKARMHTIRPMRGGQSHHQTNRRRNHMNKTRRGTQWHQQKRTNCHINIRILERKPSSVVQYLVSILPRTASKANPHTARQNATRMLDRTSKLYSIRFAR